ncbi:probable beta-1,3-galactosyltransferase 14, partial [Rutidosis leptorrhynchoides]|uniref:probable beta-1,3-galactosyltransferase 14 n=1 Tax=Rutidosis leptorrhynchoides TaxID=125765 RepID=UPI003A99454C
MPSSPKFFHARTSPLSTISSRSNLLIISCLAVGIAGFLFGLTAVLYPANSGDYNCAGGHPRSVRVVWDKSGNGISLANSNGDDSNTRPKVMGFVGIQTGFGSVGRRRSLRKTWMPSDRQGLQ